MVGSLEEFPGTLMKSEKCLLAFEIFLFCKIISLLDVLGNFSTNTAAH
jgi:hypothetical protein